jgi:predicted heme/steroid binding protein
MKRLIIVISFLVTFSVTAVLIGCSTNKPNTISGAPQSVNKKKVVPKATPQKKTTPKPSAVKKPMGKTFTLNDLKKYTGKNGTLAYVAVNGKVYDVTHAKRWRNGQHVQGISAGMDLTSAIGESPHGTSVLKDLPVVGILK